MLLVISACSGDGGGQSDFDGAPPDAAILIDAGGPDAYAEPNTRWPEEETELPACSPFAGGFAEPVLAAPTGTIRMAPSAVLQPVGYDERITVQLLDSITGLPDLSFTGPFASVSVSGNAQIVSSSDFVAGKAEIIAQFAEEGLFTISATLGDGRSGEAQIQAYISQLPIWEMTLAEFDFDYIVNNPDERQKVNASIGVNGVDLETKVRIHGGSSRDYPKKSFRFDLGQGLNLENGKNHIILRAEWNDKSLLRNYLALETFRDGTWLPTPKAEMVHFRVNGRYYGVMWHVDRVDADLLAEHGLSRNGVLLKPEAPSEYRGEDMMAPLPNEEAYEAVYNIKKGREHGQSPADIIHLVEEVLPIVDNEQFKQAVEQVVDTESYLVYLATNAIIQNGDHVKKNHYIYRDPEGDQRWRFLPWDFELTFGHLWSEENETLEEEIFIGAGIYEGMCPGYCNRMMTRFWETPAYEQVFLDQISYMLERVFTVAFIRARMDNLVCRATPDILADTNKRASNAEYLERVEEIIDFVEGQRDEL